MKKKIVVEPNFAEKEEYFKDFGKRYVSSRKLKEWNEMVEELISAKHIDALNMATNVMYDVDNGIDFDIVESAILHACDMSMQAVVYYVLFHFAKKGPEFLMKSSIFKPYEKVNKKAQREWNRSVFGAKILNEKIEHIDNELV